MSRFSPIKNSFTSGLLSERLLGRDDLDQYGAGMRLALNGVVLPHGGFQRRSGSRFVAEVKASANATALGVFDVSTNQQYVLEFGNTYVRFFANQGYVEDPGSPPNPLEVVTPYTTAQVFDLRTAQSADVMYIVHKDHYPRKLTRTAFAAFNMAKVVFRDGKAPMRPSNLTSITLAVTGAGPYTLTWSSSIGLTSGADVGRAVRFNDYYYEITAVTSGSVATADRKFTGTTTATATDWALGIFSDTEGCNAITFHEGRLWYGGTPTNPDYFVGSVSDDFDNFDRGFGAAAENADRSLAKRVVSQQINKVQWMRGQGTQLAIGTSGAEFRVFAANNGILEPTAIVVRQATARGSAYIDPALIDNQIIYAGKGKNTLYEFKYQLDQDSFRSRNLSILANDIFDADTTPASGGNVSRMAYQQNPDSVIWCVRTDGKLVGFTYEFDQKVIGAHLHDLGNGAVVEDVAVIQNPTSLFDQVWLLVKRTINGATKRYIEYIEDPYRPVLPRKTKETSDYDDRRLRRLLLERAYFVDCGLSLDLPISVSSVTKANPAVVTATAHGLSNGDTVKFRNMGAMTELENFSGTVAGATANTFQISGVDSTAFGTYASGGTVHKEVMTVSGLTHLNGETVAILADGTAHPNVVVSGGSISLTRKASIIHVGLRQFFYGETQRFTGGARLGTDQGQKTKVSRVAAILHNTMGGAFAIGPNFVTEEIDYRLGEDELDQSPPLFTGTIEVPVEGGWSNDATVYFNNDEPYPMTVLAIMPRATTNER